MEILFLVLYFININSFNNKITNDGMKLISVHLYFRHGRRTPTVEKVFFSDAFWPKWMTYDDLPFTKVKYNILNNNGSLSRPYSTVDSMYDVMGHLNGGALRGKLTILGEIDSYELGEKIKNLYISSGLLNIVNWETDLKLYSTNYDRTIDSLRCFLASFLPEDMKNKEINISVNPNELEYYHPNYRYCKKYKKLFEVSLNHTNILLEKSREELSRKLNILNCLMPTISHIWDEVSVMIWGNIPIPSVFKEHSDFLQGLALLYFKYRYIPNNESIKYGCGLLLSKMIENMQNDLTYSDSKMYVYSAHDSTILCILEAIDHYPNKEWPTFSSYLAFEQFKNEITGNNFIRINFNDNYLMFDGNEFISYEKFNNLITKFLVPNTTFEELCDDHS